MQSLLSFSVSSLMGRSCLSARLMSGILGLKRFVTTAVNHCLSVDQICTHLCTSSGLCNMTSTGNEANKSNYHTETDCYHHCGCIVFTSFDSNSNIYGSITVFTISSIKKNKILWRRACIRCVFSLLEEMFTESKILDGKL